MTTITDLPVEIIDRFADHFAKVSTSRNTSLEILTSKGTPQGQGFVQCSFDLQTFQRDFPSSSIQDYRTRLP